jgi:hypothetical protein
MGQVIFDEKDKPLMRMTYQGLSDDAEWQRHTSSSTRAKWAGYLQANEEASSIGSAATVSTSRRIAPGER